MALRLTDIRYDFILTSSERTTALDSVGLEAERGTLTLVLGATGSGKSTLLRVAAGLLVPQRGEATIDGAPLTPATARGAVGLIFQDAEAQLFAETVLEDVMFGPMNLGVQRQEAERRARAALATVGLDPERFASRSPFTLSGGEARRAAIAGVLAMEPRYLLADEPTAGLDSAGRRAVVDLVIRARARCGVVVVTHSAEEFLEHADRVLILARGREVWQGPASLLIADPTPFIEAGLAVPPVLEVQRLARERAGYDGAFTADPEKAAVRLATAAGWLT